jgi:hypothetical protein
MRPEQHPAASRGRRAPGHPCANEVRLIARACAMPTACVGIEAVARHTGGGGAVPKDERRIIPTQSRGHGTRPTNHAGCHAHGAALRGMSAGDRLQALRSVVDLAWRE